MNTNFQNGNNNNMVYLFIVSHKLKSIKKFQHHNLKKTLIKEEKLCYKQIYFL